MTLKASMILAALTLSSFSQSATAQGNLVFNGGFDAGASGWIIVNTPGGFGYSSVGGNPGSCVLLDNTTPSPSTDPTASQTINSLTPGANYIVSGDYQKQKDRGATTTPATDNSFGVAIDGAFLFEAASPTSNDLTWHSFDFLYTATSSSALLSLSSQINGTGVSYIIDNISLQAVPEPGSLYLIGLGGIISGIFFRSRGKTFHLRPSYHICADSRLPIARRVSKMARNKNRR
jgi:hypothetical protein